MRKLLIGLLLSLLIPTYCLSKPIYPDTVLTTQDYKKIALLLNEHQLYKQENSLLNRQIKTYQEIVASYNRTDSVYKEQTEFLRKELAVKDKQLKNSVKVVKYSSIATFVGVILCLILSN